MAQTIRRVVQNYPIPEGVMHGYLKLVSRLDSRKDWREMKEEELWYELCTCILSSNVPYEMATSASMHLSKRGLLEFGHPARGDMKSVIARELSRPLYLPKKRDGSFRRYRFPNVRAANIVGAAKFLRHNGNGLSSILRSFDSDIKTRDFLAAYVPGVGLKEASHFLRNIGYSTSLAIIDSHIVNFLRDTLLSGDIDTRTITQKTYTRLEDIMRNIARSQGLDLSILDHAIWLYMRNK